MLILFVMKAGRGIIHSETPIGNGPLHAFQVWVNLKSKDKMIEPFYQDLHSKDIPKKRIDEYTHISLIGGKSEQHGLQSPLSLRTNVLYMHTVIEKQSHKFIETIPKGFQGLVYVFEGSGQITQGDNQIVNAPEKSAILFDETEEDATIEFETTSPKVQLLLLAGEPLKEPMSRYGPFVMNTKEEIEQAFEDFHSGKF